MDRTSNQTERSIVFDKAKFLAAVHYIVARRSDDPDSLGKTKLHKCLYYADMLAYLDAGEPVTGVDYIKEPFGPTARYLRWALSELEKDGAISVRKRNYFGLEKFDFRSERAPASNILSSYETDLLNVVVEFVCGFGAKEISEISHAKPWKSVEMGERIPYETAFLLLPPRKPSQSDREWARERFAEARYSRA